MRVRSLFAALMLGALAVFMCGCGKAADITDRDFKEVSAESSPTDDSRTVVSEKSDKAGENKVQSGDASAEEDLEVTATPGSDSIPEEEKAPVKVVVLDPGHGDKDFGATYNGVVEKEVTLKVASYARDYLLNNYNNVEVFLTREDDTIFDQEKKVDLELRCEFAKEHSADILVSIHFNSSEKHNINGCEGWVSRRENVGKQSMELGETVVDEICRLGIKRRQVSVRRSNDMFDENGEPYDYYAINRHCAARNIPGVIIEQCFVDDLTDLEFCTTEEGLKKLGEANARGIAKYLGLESEPNMNK